MSTKRCQPNHPITGRKLSVVEIERADLLQKIFLSMDASRAAGENVAREIRRHVGRFRGRNYECNQTRKIRFSYGTLVNLFYQWIKAGRSKEFLYRRWRPVTPRVVTQSFLLEFVDYSSVSRTLSRLATWNTFVASRKAKPPVTYSTIGRYFSSRPYRRIQRALRKGRPVKAQAAAARRSIQAKFVTKGGLSA